MWLHIRAWFSISLFFLLSSRFVRLWKLKLLMQLEVKESCDTLFLGESACQLFFSLNNFFSYCFLRVTLKKIFLLLLHPRKNKIKKKWFGEQKIKKNFKFKFFWFFFAFSRIPSIQSRCVHLKMIFPAYRCDDGLTSEWVSESLQKCYQNVNFCLPDSGFLLRKK